MRRSPTPAWRSCRACRWKKLNLARCFSVTDEGFQHLAALRALRQLSIRGIPISGAGLAQLRRLRRLTALRLNETGVNDDAVAALADMPSLARLELRQTLITDAASIAWAALPGCAIWTSARPTSRRPLPTGSPNLCRAAGFCTSPKRIAEEAQSCRVGPRL